MSSSLGILWYQQIYNKNIPQANVPLPDPSKSSYSITMGPRIRALTEFYRLVGVNGNFEFDDYYHGINITQKQLISMIARLTRFVPNNSIKGFVPFVGIFENMNDAERYLASMKVEHKPSTNRENALVIISKLNFKFPITPSPTTMLTFNSRFNVKALEFKKGFKVLRSQTVYQNTIYQLKTSNPRITINISQTYQPPDDTVPNEPIFTFLRFRRQYQFYTDITNLYTSIIVPQMDITLSENVHKLNGMYLLRVNYKTNNTNAIQIKNFIQYTNLSITAEGVGATSQVQENLNVQNPLSHTGPYAINTSFMIWADHLDIPAYPLFIAYINEKNFTRE